MRNLLLYDFFNLNYFYKGFKHFNIFVGMAYLQRLDSFGLLFALFAFLKNLGLLYSNLHVISLKMGRLAAFEFNLINSSILLNTFKFVNKDLLQFIYLCGIDLDSLIVNCDNNLFFVFQGAFSDNNKLVNQFNLIFPVGVYTEVDSTYINLEGRIRQTKSAIKTHLNILGD